MSDSSATKRWSRRLAVAAVVAALSAASVIAQDTFRVNGILQLLNVGLVTATTGCTTVPYSFTGRTTTGLCSSASDQIDVYTNGTAGARFDGGLLLASTAPLRFAASGLSSPDVRCYRTGTKTLTCDDGAGGALTLISLGDLRAPSVYVTSSSGQFGSTSNGYFVFDADGSVSYRNNAGSRRTYLNSVGTPSCTSNCGTSPSVVGTNSSFTVTMGASGSPASGWVVTFSGTWPAIPQCHVTMALAGMVVGKLPLTAVPTTTTLTVGTNGTAPSNSDVYNVQCTAGS